MKGMCLIVIGLAFFMVYQTNPMGTLIIAGVILAGYAYIKSRKRGGPRRTGLFFGKGVRSMQEQGSPVNEIMTMFLVQQILDKNRDSRALTSSQTQEKNEEIMKLEQKKQEILSLLE
ncbi:MAG: hypothetical protein ACTSP9_01745 [Promethearchaeota archaeon]